VGAKLIKGSSVPSPFYFTCFFFVANNIIKVKVRVNVPIFIIFWRRHSANIEKSTISKAQKFIFCTRKKFKTNKNAIFGLFSSAKIDFLPFLKMQIMCFCTFEIALFF